MSAILYSVTVTWRPAHLSLPDDEMTVLVADRFGEVGVAYHRGNAWIDAATDSPVQELITHWAELPAAPTLETTVN